MKPLAWLLPLGALAPFLPFVVGRGVTAYREARFADAFAAFTRAEERAGNEADAELLFNRALAALQAGDLRAAELAAEKALVRGGEGFEDLRVFLFANVAIRRSLRAQAEAELRDADPTAFTRAIERCEEAIELWRGLVLRKSGADDWPEARRNLERALRMREELEAKRDEAEAKQNKKKEREEKEPEEKPEDTEAQQEEQEEKAKPQARRDLSAAELAQLFERLRVLEQEKRVLRQQRQRVRSRNVERDW